MSATAITNIVEPDAATQAKALLDVLSLIGTAASALAVIRTKVADGSPTVQNIKHLDTVISSLVLIKAAAREATARVSPVPYLLRAYDMRAPLDHATFLRDNPPPFSKSEDMWKLQCFLKHSKKSKPLSRLLESPLKSSRQPKTRKQPERAHVVPTDAEYYQERRKDEEIGSLLNGCPPYPHKSWTKEALIEALDKLEGTRKASKFISKVITVDSCPYESPSGIYTMYQQFKKNATLRNRGRPNIMLVDEAADNVRKVFKDRTSSSSAYQLRDMEKAYSSKLKQKAAANGLEEETVNTRVSQSTAKAMLISAAMGESVGKLTTKKLLTKTETRFQSKHSVMGAYAYATTVLSTHFIVGSTPSNLSKFCPDKLKSNAVETLDWMRKALDATSIYPVNPNLLFSTDDTVFFTFEGRKNSDGQWEWKLVPGDSSSNVRSNFEVGDDAENKGGLQVRLTVTLTASGLAAPPYIAITGLTDAELSPELCRDGILAVKVPGLCKGGGDIHNSGFGWLVFCRADKKDSSNSLSIANKKFIHYNDNVFMPFVREIRKKLGWTPGQEVPEYLKAVSWFDGDIGQLQTMLYEERAATDDAERIVRNKHSAAATGTQQPCDLAPIFCILRQLQSMTTAVDDTACGLAEYIKQLFVDLRGKGLNLDGKRRKKLGLIDFILCIPEMLEAVLKKKLIRKSFVEAGMTDEVTNTVPVFDALIGTCKRWVSLDKDLGIPKAEKQHCRSVFQQLMKVQLEEGQITYPLMKELGIPLGMLILAFVLTK